jgi:hypothetical protein
LPKQSHPLCSATLKNGQPCQSVATTPIGMCAGHARKAAEAAAAEAEALPGPSSVPDMGEAAAVSQPDSSSASSEADGFSSPVGEGSGSLTAEEPVRIESLRAALREGSSTVEVASLMQNMLLDGLRANKTIFSTCKKCGSRTPVDLPDLGTRISATRALIEELDGRVKQVSETADQQLDAARRKAEDDLASCSDAELAVIILAESAGTETPNPRELAQRLAKELLAHRGQPDAPAWLQSKLKPDEAQFLDRVSAHHHWDDFPESVYALAAEIVATSS